MSKPIDHLKIQYFVLTISLLISVNFAQVKLNGVTYLRIGWVESSSYNPELPGQNASTSLTAFLYGLSRIRTATSERINFNVTWWDDACNPVLAAGGGLALVDNVDIFIGPFCTKSVQVLAAVSAYASKPMVLIGSVDQGFMDYYNTLRMTLPAYRFNQRTLNMFQYYKWTQCLMVEVTDDYYSYSLGTELVSLFALNGITVFQTNIISTASEEEIINAYNKITSAANIRIIFLAVPSALFRIYLIAAYDAGLISAGYILISYNYNKNLDITIADNLWAVGDGLDYKVIAALQNFYLNRISYLSAQQVIAANGNSQVLLAAPNLTQLGIAAAAAANNVLQTSGINFLSAMPSANGFDATAPVLIDSMQLVANIFNYSLGMNQNISNATTFSELAPQFSFNGVSGNVMIDGNLDRYSDFFLIYFRVDLLQWQAVRFLQYTLQSDGISLTESKIQISPIVWPGGAVGDQNAPPDTICVNCSTFSTVLLVVIIVCAVLVIGALIGCFYYTSVRSRRLYEIQWQIPIDQLQLSEEKRNGSSLTSDLGSESAASASDQDTETEKTSAQLSAVSTNRVAGYKGERVFVKKLPYLQQQRLSPQNEMKLKQMISVSNQNVNAFLGVAFGPNEVLLVWTLCLKGGLRRVLDDQAITLEGIFSLSFIADIARGMDYLHRSPVGYHGNLTSSSVLVDSKWTCKISDFGFSEYIFVSAQSRFSGAAASVISGSGSISRASSNSARVNKEYGSLLWVAPELVTSQFFSRSGTKVGDVYSFGVICFEVLTRRRPFANYQLSAQGIVEQISAGRLLRPFSTDELATLDSADELKSLSCSCISHLPESRPQDFESVLKSLQKIKGFHKTANAVDNLIRMMEKYTENLEQIVSERTKRLVEEEKKAEALLYKMLPRKVADALKQGRVIQAECYDQVTIYFSDVVNFTVLCGESSPMDVINFLNKLYGCFDEIIAKHEVYKVETIGDAYLIAGGLPEPIGERHVTEIANCALEILKAVEAFEIPHKPGRKLQVRIGLHSGSCCAGVVGFQMPRYCVFGDTINTASRMESQGLPMHIQISGACRNLLVRRAEYLIQSRGEMTVKGKGLMNTYWLVGRVNHTDFSQYIKPEDVAS